MDTIRIKVACPYCAFIDEFQLPKRTYSIQNINCDSEDAGCDGDFVVRLVEDIKMDVNTTCQIYSLKVYTLTEADQGEGDDRNQNT